ncbi:MAG TPA: phosphatase, partial [Clostridiales bacterium]|nr:phosphatase [Clostridiales bacterium]
MKPLIADLHMHSLMSGHAFGTIRELAFAAAERKLLAIGVTEQ